MASSASLPTSTGQRTSATAQVSREEGRRRSRSPLDERPHLRPWFGAGVHRGEEAGGRLQVVHGAVLVASRMQQVGEVRVEGGHPVPVAVRGAEGEGLA